VDVWACGGRRLSMVGGQRWSELHRLVEWFVLKISCVHCCL